MASVDWLIIVALAFAAFSGFRLGFVTRSASWVGMLAGAVVALLVLPSILRKAETMAQSTQFGIAVLFLIVGSLLGQMLGLVVGDKLTNGFVPLKARRIDQIFGAFAGMSGVVIALWLVLPAAANVPGLSAQTVRGSIISRAIYNHGPKPPNAIMTLQRLVGSNTFPSVFQGINQSPEAGPAPSSVTLPQNVIETTEASSVKIEGLACHRTQDGSGFVVAPNLIATNAHVVAGEDKTTVIAEGGEQYSATVVAFDAQRDIALLNVPKFNAAPLSLGSATIGETGAVFGHPEGVPQLIVSPAAVRREITAIGRDLYDKTTTHRDVLILASPLEPGDSGGALVDDQGRVVGVAFAIAPDKPGTSYALGISELQSVLAQPHDSKIDTGRCLTD